MPSINSPFRYAGGKFYARKLISEHLNIPHTVYCEPFAGGGSVFFHKELAEHSILNDIDPMIALVYRVIRDNPEELIGLIDGFMEPSKEAHNYYKNNYTPTNELEQAARWYYLNRISYSGIMKNDNMYFGYNTRCSMVPANWPRNIRRVSEKMQGIEVRNDDFEAVINEMPDGALLFLDPPYFNADQDKFYTHFFSREDHLRLCDVIHRNYHRLHIFITYDNCEEIKRMYDWEGMNFYDQEWNYCISRTDDQVNHTDVKGTRKKGKELFIINY